MLKFNKEQFLQDGQKVYELRDEIEKLADQLHNSGYSNIILTGVGGTTAELYSVKDIIQRYSNLEVHLLNAA